MRTLISVFDNSTGECQSMFCLVGKVKAAFANREVERAICYSGNVRRLGVLSCCPMYSIVLVLS